jgi:hypothetical protein
MKSIETLSAVERRVLSHVGRFRLTTCSVWDRVFDVRNIPYGDIADAVGRLLKEGYLNSGTLIRSVRYFVLSEKGASAAKQFGLTKEQAVYGLLSERAKIKACGILDLCADSKVNWLPANNEESREFYGEGAHGLPAGLLIDKSSDEYCFCRVDGSIESLPKRSAQTIRADILHITKQPRLATARNDKKLKYAFVTATKPRADRILEQFRNYSDMKNEPIHLRVAPILVPLLQSIPIGTKVIP